MTAAAPDSLSDFPLGPLAGTTTTYFRSPHGSTLHGDPQCPRARNLSPHRTVTHPTSGTLADLRVEDAHCQPVHAYVGTANRLLAKRARIDDSATWLRDGDLPRTLITPPRYGTTDQQPHPSLLEQWTAAVAEEAALVAQVAERWTGRTAATILVAAWIRQGRTARIHAEQYARFEDADVTGLDRNQGGAPWRNDLLAQWLDHILAGRLPTHASKLISTKNGRSLDGNQPWNRWERTEEEAETVRLLTTHWEGQLAEEVTDAGTEPALFLYAEERVADTRELADICTVAAGGASADGRHGLLRSFTAPAAFRRLMETDHGISHVGLLVDDAASGTTPPAVQADLLARIVDAEADDATAYAPLQALTVELPITSQRQTDSRRIAFADKTLHPQMRGPLGFWIDQQSLHRARH